ncbi:FecR family protein [Frigidibacter mobilis]|uniref:Putative iron transport regulator transmembrane protein n=1 Tax=Frigidibacter mobilis TaxID=1335048 RepID=A0A159Z0Q7_9RHOB|nr:FecR domain-containing protein [Frigidibacter mobilis]AMY68387.1 putative iron transport regulator transmembrane protein [Frigidibacter mobilis]
MSRADTEQFTTADGQALDWLIRLREAPGNAQVRDDHLCWLQADPAHAAAWQGACATWQMLGLTRAAPTRPSPRRPARSIGLGAMALAAAVVMALILGPDLWMRIEADHRTGTAETRVILLDDGSRLTLDAGSAVQLQFSAGRRDVRLLRGAAFFEVAPDPARPFTVRNGGLSATALGTAFEVAEAGGATAVAVTEGVVAIVGADDANLPDPLQGGDWARLGPDGQIEQGEGDPAMFGGWRSGLLVVEDRPVAEVADALERHTGGRTVILGGASSRHVTGYFDLSNPEAALLTLADSLDLRLRQVGSVRVLSVR